METVKMVGNHVPHTCIDCGSEHLTVEKRTIDRITECDMPHPLKAALGFIIIGIGHVPVAWALTVGSPLLYLFVVVDVFMVFFGWQICWLELWGQAVTQHTAECADCGHTWRIVNDGSQTVQQGNVPVRRSRRARVRA